MKTLTKSILIVLCLTLLSSAQLFGQEWSEEQKEAWKHVETGWDLWVKQDLEGLLATYHDDISDWNNQDALPANKILLRKNFAHQFKTIKVLIYDIQPVEIKIHDNVAIIHYYWSEITKNAEGQETNLRGRFTDILMKEGDKWVLIGGSGGSTE